MRDEPALSVPPGAAELPTASPDAAADDADVVVIGGGINGTGVARDLSLRGLKVSLFERNDLSFGASGNSSGMIHGGVRYLTTDPGVTETSCRDSGYIQTIAPHLLFRIPFLMPLRGGARGRVMRELIDAFFRGYDDYQPLKRGKPHCRLDATDLRRLEPGLTGPLAGGITFDEWGVDGTRLCVLNALDAVEHGARVRTHTTVDSIERLPGGERVAGPRYVVQARDRATGGAARPRAPPAAHPTGAGRPLPPR